MSWDCHSKPGGKKSSAGAMPGSELIARAFAISIEASVLPLLVNLLHGTDVIEETAVPSCAFQQFRDDPWLDSKTRLKIGMSV